MILTLTNLHCIAATIILISVLLNKTVCNILGDSFCDPASDL